MHRLKRTAYCLLLLSAAALLAVVTRSAVPPAASAQPGESPSSPPAPRRVKVLWLGDQGHHLPLERCRQAFSPLARNGIDLTYTENVAELNAKTLDNYDCLLLY